MTWTVTNYLDRTRSIADATSSTRWDNTIDVLPALGMAHTREWKRILNANQYYRTNSISATQGSTGTILLTALDAGSADSQKRFYRVLWVSDGNMVYNQVAFGQIPLATVNGAAYAGKVWYRTDTALQIIPASSGQVMTVVVNHTPTPIDQLSGVGVAVEFPRDYELVLCYEAAAWLLAKGGAELDTTNALQRMADQIRSDMLGDIARDSTSPTWMDFPDTSAQWSGV